MKAGQILAVLAGGWLALAAWAEAPSIVLRDLDGKSRNVNEFIGRGQWTVVTTWAHDCHICSREIHEMSAFHLAHRGRDAIVLGVTVDGYDEVQAARAFVKRHDLPFVNLVAEPKQAVMTQFGAGRFVGTPTYYIYDPKGEIVGQQIGPLTRDEVEAFMESFSTPAADASGSQP